MRKVPILLCLALLAAACAKQGYPSGGPRDTQPPQAVACRPANESHHFSRQQFFVEFDEYIVLKDAANNVLVSPPLKQKPEYTVKGKGVLVSWTDTLQPDATYLFQFKNAVADFTEGNLLPSFEYVFSTGSAMDTLMLAGSIVNARNGKAPGEPLSVLAYRQEHCTSDTVALSTQPDYITRTDKEGRFAFHYIPAGRYRLVALDDKNRDLRLGPAESVAWDTTFFAAADSVDSTAMPKMRLSTPDRRQQRLLKAEFTEKGHITISTLMPMKAPVLSGDSLVMRLGGHGDTLRVWLMDEQRDSTVLVLTDASGLADTLRLKYRAPSRNRGGRRSSRQQAERTPLVRALCAGQNAFYDDLRLAFANPVVPSSDSLTVSIMLLKDSLVTRHPIVFDPDGLGARIEASLRSGERYVMRLDAGFVTDIYGHSSDSLKVEFSPKDYGILSLHIESRFEAPLLIEVLDSRDTVMSIQPVPASGQLRFDHLPAAEYRLRAIVDSDGNGVWTPGDYLEGRQPEEWYLYEKTLQLREKWEMEERWEVGRKVTATAPARQNYRLDNQNVTPRELEGGTLIPKKR